MWYRKKDTMKIGENNHFMVGCRTFYPFDLIYLDNNLIGRAGIESPSIGNNNIFQPKSTASGGVIVTDNCIISPSCVVGCGKKADNNDYRRRHYPLTVPYRYR